MAQPSTSLGWPHFTRALLIFASEHPGCERVDERSKLFEAVLKWCRMILENQRMLSVRFWFNRQDVRINELQGIATSCWLLIWSTYKSYNWNQIELLVGDPNWIDSPAAFHGQCPISCYLNPVFMWVKVPMLCCSIPKSFVQSYFFLVDPTFWWKIIMHICLVVWNIWIIFPYLGNVIIPTDFHSIIFQRRGIPPTSYGMTILVIQIVIITLWLFNIAMV